MLAILLKSSACLAVFMLFYKLCLEKTSAHTFKRFYLIAVILISIGIPFITFTEYIEVTPLEDYNITNTESLNIEILEQSNLEFTNIEKPINYLPIISWGIYLLGVIVFLFRFSKNLHTIFKTIKHNTSLKIRHSFLF